LEKLLCSSFPARGQITKETICYYFTGYKFFFLIGNKNFIEKTEHCVHDGKHFEQEQDTDSY